MGGGIRGGFLIAAFLVLGLFGSLRIKIFLGLLLVVVVADLEFVGKVSDGDFYPVAFPGNDDGGRCYRIYSGVGVGAVFATQNGEKVGLGGCQLAT